MENWKEVENTNGTLLISDLGRVKSLLSGKILAQTRVTDDYLIVRFRVNGIKKSFKIHRMVAKAFIPNPEGKREVNHINGNKNDNRVCNLEWATRSENARHAIRTGLWNHQMEILSNANKQRMTPVKATNIKTGEVLYFDSVSAAQKGLNSQHISAVLKGQRSQTKGYVIERWEMNV